MNAFYRAFASLYLIFAVEYLAARMTFQTVQQDKALNGLTPYVKQKVLSRITCHLLCQQSPDKCCYIQFQKQNDEMICSLYDFVGDINKHLSAAPGSVISSPKANPQMDCLDWRRLGHTQNGVYYINFYGYRRKVFCDMTTDGGGWIVMQKRFDGSIDFDGNWTTFKDGFGDVYTEYWLGNEFVHQYTSHQPTEGLVEARNFSDVRAAVKLDNVVLSSEANTYTITFLCSEVTHSDLCANWNYLKGKRFSTKDRDMDYHQAVNCAQQFKAGWWHNSCLRVNFNYAIYRTNPVLTDQAQGIVWFDLEDDYTALKSTKMMIRRRV